MKTSLFAFLIGSFLLTACSSGNVTVDDSLQRYFDSAGVKGSFSLFDNGQGHFTIYNLSRYRDSLYQPGATFDILMSLIAIQTGVVKDDTSSLTPALTLGMAFHGNDDSSRLAFQALVARLGKDTMKKWIDSLQYGNK